MANLRISISFEDAARLLRALILVDLVLVFVFIADGPLGFPGRIRNMFDLDAEATIPAWFASSQLLATGLLFFLLGRLSQSNRVVSRMFFPLVGTGFAFLSMDEAAGIHESITALLLRFEFMPRFAGGHGIWIFVYLVIGTILVAVTRHDIFAMWKNFRNETLLLASGMIIFLLGGIVLEIFSYSIVHDGTNAVLDMWQVATEEFLELAGISITLFASTLLLLRMDTAIDVVGN